MTRGCAHAPPRWSRGAARRGTPVSNFGRPEGEAARGAVPAAEARRGSRRAISTDLAARGQLPISTPAVAHIAPPGNSQPVIWPAVPPTLLTLSLRNPDSARFGGEEYIVEQKVDLSTPTRTGEVPAKSYAVVGTVNGQNGFGGMTELTPYKCWVGLNKDGEVIRDENQSYAEVRTDDSIESIMSQTNENAIGSVVTKTAAPEGNTDQ